MSLLNRLIVSGFFLLLLTAAVGAVFMILGVFTIDPGVVPPELAENLNKLTELRGNSAAIAAVIAMGVVVVSVYGMQAELFPGSFTDGSFLIEDTGQGVITVEHESVCSLIERSVRALGGVRDVQADVRRGDSGGLVVNCRVIADPNADLKEMGPIIQHEVQRRIDAQLGLPVESVRARIRFIPYSPQDRALL